MIGGVNNKLVRSFYYDKLVVFLFGGFSNVLELIMDVLNILDIVGNSYRVNYYWFFN